MASDPVLVAAAISAIFVIVKPQDITIPVSIAAKLSPPLIKICRQFIVCRQLLNHLIQIHLLKFSTCGRGVMFHNTSNQSFGNGFCQFGFQFVDSQRLVVLYPYPVGCCHGHLFTFFHAVPEVVAIDCRIQLDDELLDGVELLVHGFQLFLNRPNKVIEVIDGVPFDNDDSLKLAHREIAMFCEKFFERSASVIKILTALYPEIAIEGIPDNTILNLLDTLLQVAVEIGDCV